MNTPPPISVYKSALSKIKRRLLWDLNRNSRSSKKHLRSILNRNAGQKAVIACNGPSLLQADFSALQQSGIFTFGLNKINLLFDKTDWRPDCVVSINKHVIEQNADFFRLTKIQLYLSNMAVRQICKRANVCYLDTQAGAGAFAKNCSGAMTEGHTVTYVAMQLAFHMGFQQVALIGCDHNFATKGPANKAVKAEGDDPNHFDPNYFSGGVTWQLPDLVKSELHYQIAAETFSNADRRLVNCTDGGELDLFPRELLADFIAS